MKIIYIYIQAIKNIKIFNEFNLNLFYLNEETTSKLNI